jgi:hypothetical protein
MPHVLSKLEDKQNEVLAFARSYSYRMTMHFVIMEEILNSSGSLASKSSCNDTNQIPAKAGISLFHPMGCHSSESWNLLNI